MDRIKSRLKEVCNTILYSDDIEKVVNAHLKYKGIMKINKLLKNCRAISKGVTWLIGILEGE